MFVHLEAEQPFRKQDILFPVRRAKVPGTAIGAAVPDDAQTAVNAHPAKAPANATCATAQARGNW